MTFKDKVIKYLEDFIDDKFCDYATGRDIRVFVLPHIKSMQEDPVSEDLLSAANNAWLKAKDTESYADTFTEGFKAGAQWQKEQMMTYAVDGAFIRRNRYTKTNVLNGLDITCDEIQSFKDKDKIKVLFVKED